VWRGEAIKFSKIKRRITKAEKIADLNLWLRGKTDVLLLSYDRAARWAQYLEAHMAEVCIFDEAHYMKSPTAQRTRALLGAKCDGTDGVGRWAARTWFLTGTPAPNDPSDIWSLLRFTGATPLGLATFVNRYLNVRPTAYSTVTTPKPAMVEELRGVIGGMSMRRTKADVALQVPPIWLTTQTIEGDTTEIRLLLAQHPGLDQAIMDAVAKGGLSFLDAQHIATLRRLTGEAKAPAMAELLKEELANGVDKIVVFGLHRRALDIVSDRLGDAGIGCVRLDGQSSESERVESVRAFQGDSDCRVFLGNIRAAGTGITLTAAAEIIVFEPDWSPANNAQALMRVHRLGQTRNVRARFIALANSIDVQVINTLASKTSALARIGFDGLTAPPV
jgi:SNF2 family DNA or RNA helicase